MRNFKKKKKVVFFMESTRLIIQEYLLSLSSRSFNKEMCFELQMNTILIMDYDNESILNVSTLFSAAAIRLGSKLMMKNVLLSLSQIFHSALISNNIERDKPNLSYINDLMAIGWLRFEKIKKRKGEMPNQLLFSMFIICRKYHLCKKGLRISL